MSGSVYIETYGCQMNVADSELMAGILNAEGYSSADSVESADIVLLNTCAIRDKAEERIFGRLGWLKSAKRERPEMIVGVAGCMAEHIKERLLRRAPYVDLVIGPDAYRRLPAMIHELRSTSRDPLIDVRLDRRELYHDIEPKRSPGVSGFISIMRGCDRFCTFCIVPYVRGRERSLSPDEIVEQVVAMSDAGFREVTLLGQTVSSYHYKDTADETCDFAGLLQAIHARCDLRIRFTSPYPTDFDNHLLDTIAELPRVGRHLHLPLQSGSSRVLNDMRREYDAPTYRDVIRRVHQRLPDFALSTDIIVGYPGESEADFEETLTMARECAFDSAFMFMYSEREGTAAARTRADDIPDEVKRDRLQRLIAVQESTSRRRSAERIGRIVDVLVTGTNPRDPTAAIGRSSSFHTTVIKGGAAHYPPGSMVNACVESASTHTLFATPIVAPNTSSAHATVHA